MTDEKIQAILDEYKDVPRERPPLIDTGRKKFPLSKFPPGLDFSKTIGNTTYTVRSYFNPKASECLYAKINRLMFGDPNLQEYDGDF